jgi:hypothetical protein
LAEQEQSKEPADLFHHGTITKLFPSNNMGLVRIESGREIQFAFDLVILVGDARKPADLKEGMEVGYDLGWTSKGLRVTKINVRSQPEPPQPGAELERQEGQSQDLPPKDFPNKDP